MPPAGILPDPAVSRQGWCAALGGVLQLRCLSGGAPPCSARCGEGVRTLGAGVSRAPKVVGGAQG